VTGSLRLIGLTGGIGSGKSTVARLLAARGVPVLDADELAREVVLPGGEALAEIARAWPEVLDARGQLDRRKLGAVVFSDAAALARLEAIMHPRIAALSNRRAAELARAGHRLAFYEASLLVETGRARELDGLVVVDAPVDTRIARVVARDGVTAAEVRARMAAQQPIDEKRRVATHIIENAGTILALTAQVEAMLEAIRAEQSESGPA
jgi:dephospho-CoA kinase